MPMVYQVKSHSYDVNLIIRMSTYIESIKLVNARIGSEQYTLTPSIWALVRCRSTFKIVYRCHFIAYFFSLCSNCFHRIVCSAVVLDPKFSCRVVTWVLLLSPSFRHRYRSCVSPYTDLFTAFLSPTDLCIHHFILHRSSTVTWCATRNIYKKSGAPIFIVGLQNFAFPFTKDVGFGLR